MSVTRIAEKAGVSIATVSRVLNNSRNVNPKLAEQVRKAAEELQLPVRPPRRKNRPRGKDRQTTIAILSVGQAYRGWFEMPVIAEVVAELTRAAQEQHFGVLMSELQDPRNVGQQFKRSDVQGGLAFINSAITSEQVQALAAQLPIVRVMGAQVSPAEIDHIAPDNNAVGFIAAEYLLGKQVDELAFLTCRPMWDFSLLRAQGFMAGASRANRTHRTYIQAQSAAGYGFFGADVTAAPTLPELLDRLMAHRKGRLGLFVSRDEETVEVYRTLAPLGARIGKDIVIVSCDNELVRLSTLHPQPASIDLVPAKIAHHAVRQLAARIENRDMPPVRILISPKLVEGELD